MRSWLPGRLSTRRNALVELFSEFGLWTCLCLAGFPGGGAGVQTVTWNLVYLIDILYEGPIGKFKIKMVPGTRQHFPV